MNNKKVGIVGVGNVGSTLAYTLASKGICTSIILKDIRENIVQAMALDISQAANAAKSHTVVKAAVSGKDLEGCDVVVITAGLPRTPGMSRDDLLIKNANIMQSVMKDVKTYASDAKIIIVSNPLDAMVYTALKVSGFPREQVVGMAGILDSARMSHFILDKLGYGAGQIESSVMGGHGDDMVPLPNFSTVAGVPMSELLCDEDIQEIVDKTKNGGLQIVKLLETGSAYYAPAHATSLMVEAILHNKKKIYPCAVCLEGEYGYDNIVSGVPVMLGSKGVEKVIELNLNDEQKVQIGEGEVLANKPISICGPGTGLGVANVIPVAEQQWQALGGEGGHVDFAPIDKTEIEILEFLLDKYQHVSYEQLLSGLGIEQIYQALNQIEQAGLPNLSAKDISEKALTNSCVLCEKTLAQFCKILGSFAGNLALTFASFGGVYIAGGIVPRFIEYFKQSEFRSRFESKGRITFNRMIPTFVITESQPGILGASAYLRQHNLQHQG